MRVATGWGKRTRAGLRLITASLVVGLATVAVAVLPAQVASATAGNTYYVNKASDTGSVTDCTTYNNTDCGIDDAIAAFNADTTPNDADTIVFNSSIATFTVGTPTAINNTTTGVTLAINGNGVSATAVSGGTTNQVFNIATGTTVTISGLTIENGSATLGGGIANYGTTTVTDSTLSHNSATESGGGISSNPGATLTVTDSTLSGNTATLSAGGILTLAAGPTTVTDSTLSGNIAGTDYGGGILAYEGTTTVTDSTLSGNIAGTSDGGGGIYNYSDSATITLGATIVANSDSSGGDCAGTITDQGYNIADDASCGFSATGSTNSSPTLDASLGSLKLNGGPTDTILPSSTSPAVGVIPSGTTLNSVSVCPRSDQRGVASIGKCTIGAVEGVFRIATTTLPNATPGTVYGPVTLTTQDAGLSTSPYVTSLKWKKVSLPKGLKLSKTGVLSGTPSKRLTAGTSSVKVQVTETVTTRNGKKKVKTKTTVQATIPLSIT